MEGYFAGVSLGCSLKEWRVKLSESGFGAVESPSDHKREVLWIYSRTKYLFTSNQSVNKYGI